MRIQAILLTLAFSLFSLTAIAGAGHEHSHSHDPVNRSQAETNATKSVSKLVNNNKIEKSWKSAMVMKSEKKKFGKNMEWVVEFNNEHISDLNNQTLYIFLNLEGEYLAMNFTGK